MRQRRGRRGRLRRRRHRLLCPWVRAFLTPSRPMTEKGYAPGSDFPPVLFATAARGTEGAVRDELRELGFRGVRADRGGVHFGGGLDEGARACVELRTAIRVLYRLAEIEAPT